jgi:hypothetical protein
MQMDRLTDVQIMCRGYKTYNKPHLSIPDESCPAVPAENATGVTAAPAKPHAVSSSLPGSPGHQLYLAAPRSTSTQPHTWQMQNILTMRRNVILFSL